MTKLFDIFLEFFVLGCYAFGGPTAHVGYFRTRFVAQLQRIDDARFTELTALTQLLPGPGSSQLGMAIGYHLAGQKNAIWGSVMAFLGFTLPSAILLIVAGLSVRYGWFDTQWLGGLKVLAVVVVFDALRGMIRSACPTPPLLLIALITAMVTLMWQGLWGQLLMIAATTALALSVYADYFVPRQHQDTPIVPLTLPKTGAWFMTAFIVSFIVLPLLAHIGASFAVFDSFYRSGALVFGGGHVVLPLLWEAPLVKEIVPQSTFFAGYSLAQAVPGPMFTFATFLGATAQGSVGGVFGGLLATLAIFLPGWLLLMAILPVWSQWRDHAALQRVLTLISAATVGLLGSAFISPVLGAALVSPLMSALALLLWMLKNQTRLPILGLVVISGVLGAVL